VFRESNFARAVEAAGLHPKRVVIRNTKCCASLLDTLARAATPLRAAGFHIALDGMRPRNKGLWLRRRLPVDFVKIVQIVAI
jgi:EAL domain-containing protein (putative c-di-GMP-specific phosphodiesterase class I)